MSVAAAPRKTRSSRLGKSGAAAARNRARPAKSLQRKALTPTPAIPGSLIQLKADPEKKKKIQRQTGGKLEENLQKKTPEPEKKKPVQMKSAVPVGPAGDALEKEADQVAQRVVQMKAAPAIEPKKEPLIQKKSISNNSPTHTDLSGLDGPGAPLPDTIQRNMEQHLDTDFSDVTVHDDEASQLKSSELGARAFTHGSNIYLGPGESRNDVALMAHELTHVAQQRGGAVNSSAQRKNEKDSSGTTGGSLSTGIVDTAKKTITYDFLTIPEFKGKDHRGKLYQSWQLKRSHNYTGSRPSNQQELWKSKVDKKNIISTLQSKATSAKFTPEGNSYIFKGPARPITRGGKHRKRGQKHYYFGSLQDIAKSLAAPSWGRKNWNTASMEVDHIVELQVSGYPQDKSAHKIDNMELLERRVNSQSGRAIKKSILNKLKKTLKDKSTVPLLSQSIPALAKEKKSDKKINIVKNNFDLIFKGFEAKGGPKVTENQYWSRSDIEKGEEHLKPVKVASFSELDKSGTIYIFPFEHGGIGKRFKWDGKKRTPLSSEKEWFKPFTMTAKRFFTGTERGEKPHLGEFDLEIPETDKTYKPLKTTVFVNQIDGSDFSGSVKKAIVRRMAEKIELKKTSPITVENISIDPDRGIFMYGKVLPTIPLIKGAHLSYRLENGALTVFKVFNTGSFKFPAPITVDNSNLTLALSTGLGMKIDGQVDFSIKDLGTGFLQGNVSSEGDFGIKGGFDFDSKLFNPARISVEYKNNEFSGEGELGIQNNKVPGIKSAAIKASFYEDKIAASGKAILLIPGVKEAALSILYSKKEGVSIGGECALSNDIPGIKSGSVKVHVKENKDRTGYEVSAEGEAVPSLPGINSKLKIKYENGLFDASVAAQYQRGLLSGQIYVGVTNQQVSNGAKVDSPPPESAPLTIYGGGGLTLQLAPWLKAGATVILLPDGSVQVTGEIGLPKAINLFDKKKYEPDKPLFKVGIDIPIVGVSFLGKRIGIFANVSGGLEAAASIGPGQLTDLGLSVTYNPDREQDTKVTGKAKLNVPAYAGLTLFISGSIGAGLLIVSAQGGLRAKGTLGVAGALNAGVDVDWTPQKGFVLDAVASVEAQPKLRIGLSAFVSVEADVFLGTIDLYDDEWELAAKEFGSNLKVGVSFPVHYEEGKKFNIGLDDVKFTYPKINVLDTVKGLID